MKPHRHLIASGALLALAALGARTLTEAPSRGAPAAAPPPHRRAATASRATYALRLDVDVTLGERGGAQAVAFSIAGRWESTMARRGDEAVELVRLTDARTLRGDPGIAAALSGPCATASSSPTPSASRATSTRRRPRSGSPPRAGSRATTGRRSSSTAATRPCGPTTTPAPRAFATPDAPPCPTPARWQPLPANSAETRRSSGEQHPWWTWRL